MAKAISKAPGNFGPVLNPEKTVCTIGDIQLRIDQSIDFKSAIDIKISMGKIVSFMYAGHQQSDKESIWMNVKDILTEGSPTEWISVNVWIDQHNAGLFNNKKYSKDDASKKSKSTGKHPF